VPLRTEPNSPCPSSSPRFRLSALMATIWYGSFMSLGFWIGGGGGYLIQGRERMVRRGEGEGEKGRGRGRGREVGEEKE